MNAINPAIPPLRASRLADLFAPATVVLFAGCGGTCIGIEQAYVDGAFADKYVDLAINHWDTAVGVHERNHPFTQHLRGDVREIDPKSVLLGRDIGYLHASPDCTHFSKARGSKPKKKEIRGLAWVVVDWARDRHPDVITLENVEEFREWGPLADDGQPCPQRKGETFREWKAALEALGYVVDHRELRACDYGAPTTRKRLFVVARRDGKEIIWPEKTHGNSARSSGDIHRSSRRLNRSGDRRVGSVRRGVGRDGGSESPARAGETKGDLSRSILAPFRTAAECIDWSIPMLSIFAKPEQARAWRDAVNVGRPKHEQIGTPVRPLKPKTMQRIARGLVKWVIEAKRPYIVDIENANWAKHGHRDIAKPLNTITASPKGGKHAAVDVALAPYSVPRYGEREGQQPRTSSINEPMPTVVGTGNQSALVAALMTKHYGGVTGHGLEQPLGSVTGVDHHSLTVAYLSHQYTSNACGGQGDPEKPLKTITSGGHHALVTAYAQTLNHGGEEHRGADLREPLATVTGANDARAIVAAFLQTYYGNSKDGHSAAEPMPTVVSKDRIGLVTVVIDGQTFVITDILMRMLTPKELALAQGFPPEYDVSQTADGTRVSKADQVKLLGNAVPPPFARALAHENVVKQGVLGTPAKRHN